MANVDPIVCVRYICDPHRLEKVVEVRGVTVVTARDNMHEAFEDKRGGITKETGSGSRVPRARDFDGHETMEATWKAIKERRADDTVANDDVPKFLPF
ncbi:hypothetical protein CRG98_022539 [Punica granatum]|uniref:Uncharacterized protein n=1 Tax=Punica granatum TaxID=22663 RepID=A0A2I0JL56_PUNGR|nr:hypothetical protein CRG98_022539 [Punica granatum]